MANWETLTSSTSGHIWQEKILKKCRTKVAAGRVFCLCFKSLLLLLFFFSFLFLMLAKCARFAICSANSTVTPMLPPCQLSKQSDCSDLLIRNKILLPLGFELGKNPWLDFDLCFAWSAPSQHGQSRPKWLTLG